MTTRKIAKLLPEYLANEQLTKFFDATVDQWFQPERSKKIAGFVGRVPNYYDSTKDFYINETTESRQFYQLEANMVSRNSAGTLTNVLSYPDLVDKLRYQGALTENHSRLFEQYYYSWCPPIDVDMFVNYSNYYWYPEGPTPIEIKGNANNTIDVEKDILGQKTYTSVNGITFMNGIHVTFGSDVIPSSYQTGRWIVEGVGQKIRLVNFDFNDQSEYPVEYSDDGKDYITIERGSDNFNPWSRTNHWYHKDVITFISNNSPVVEEEYYLWDTFPWDTVEWDAKASSLSSGINLDTDRRAKRPIISFDASLNLYNYGTSQIRFVDIVDDIHSNIFSDIHGKNVGTVQINGTPLTDGMRVLSTTDNNPSTNNRIYTISFIEKSIGVFVYNLALDTAGHNIDGSPQIDEPVYVYGSGKIFHYDGEGFVESQRKISRNQQPLFTLYDNDGKRLDDESYKDSTFMGNPIFEYKKGSETTSADIELGFPVVYKSFSQLSEITFNNALYTSTYSYEIEPLVRVPIQKFYYYKNEEGYGNSWHRSSEKSFQDTSFGFYNIPSNLQANPDNEEIGEFSRSDIIKHFNSIIVGQDDINSDIPSDTNYRNIKHDLSKGTEIRQHSASLLKLMMLASDDNIDILNAIRFSQREYSRFYNKLLNKIKAFTESGYDENTPANIWLDDAIHLINVSKKSDKFPFSKTIMLPVGNLYNSFKYDTVPGDYTFHFDGDYTPMSCDIISRLLVYVDDVLQMIDVDYTVVDNDVIMTAPLSGNHTVELRYFTSVFGSFVPNTPASMGITRLYKPEKVIDTSYTYPRTVIVCHDGSVVPSFGDFRDEVVLEFEKRIYNTTCEKFHSERRFIFDSIAHVPGKFRKTSYSYDDFSTLIRPVLSTWASLSGINWTENVSYDPENWKSWNWSSSLDEVDGEPLNGSWRGVYKYYYDTDEPHTKPWEMLGFSFKPEWWEDEYGTAPYTSTNEKMWKDLSEGFIRQGSRQGIDPNYVRDRLLQIIPVTDGGALLNPFEAGITKTLPNAENASQNWRAGDYGPVEASMWRGNEGSFVLSQILYLMYPAIFVETNWDTSAIAFSNIAPDQVINSRFLHRPSNSELTLSGEDDTYIQGIQQWLIDFLQFSSLDISENLGDVMRGLDVNLGWKSGSFAKSSTMRFLVDSYSPNSKAKSQKIFIQDNDLSINLYKSPSINEMSYSGVIVEWTGSGYAVFGYDNYNPTFKVIPNMENARSYPITVADVTVTETRQGTDEIVEYEYGHVFKSRQELFDFLTEYGRWQESQGWVFDNYDNTSNEIFNWRYSGKEFLFWSQDALKEGAFIALSPLADSATFKMPYGNVNNITEVIQGSYPILDRQGQVITKENLYIKREADSISIKSTGDLGMYAIKLSISTYEHIILVNNKTRFEDIIYEPLFNLRQQRLKVFGVVTDGWTGNLEAPGFVIDMENNGDLINNFEKTANDFLRYHSIENPSENDAITNSARHLIGYQRREYLDQLLVDRDVQYEFYQGMIQQKGSRNSLNKLFRSTAITSKTDVQFYEEWAFRTGKYGGVDVTTPMEFSLSSEDIKINPQTIRFSYNTFGDVDTDNIVDIVDKDGRWIQAPSDNFALRSGNYFKRDLPNSGFAQLGETSYLAIDERDLFNPEKEVFWSEDGETVWVANNNQFRIVKNWDVLEFTPYHNFVWYSGNNDSNVVYSYRRNTTTSNGITNVFNSTSSITLNEDTVNVYVDGRKTSEFSILGTSSIVFDTVPKSGSIVWIDALDNHDYNNLSRIVSLHTEDSRNVGMIESVDSTSITFKDEYNFTATMGAKLSSWVSRRFENINGLSAETYKNKLIYIDKNESNGWSVYKSDGSVFHEMRREENLVDTSLIRNALVYNDLDNTLKAKMTVLDPFKGYIPGIADAEITFKLEYDPAKYTNNLNGDSFDDKIAWGNNEVGKVWWDTSAMRYMWYEQGSIEYRYTNWGKMFPGSEVKVYEWVKSPVHPEDWESYVQENMNNFDFAPAGTVKDIEEGPSWVERNEVNHTTGEVKVVYYFWIENKNSVPNLDFRSIPLTEIKSILTNPFAYGLKYCAALMENVFILANIDKDLEKTDTIVQVNFNSKDVDVPIHTQWELLREGDGFSIIKDVLWNKMRDSLVGFDDMNKEVPAVNLKGKARYGSSIRPRQSWFKDKLTARQIFIEATNKILKNIDLVTEVDNFDTYLTSKDSLQTASNILLGSSDNPYVTAGDEMSINGDLIAFSGVGNLDQIVTEINDSITSETTFADIVYVGTHQRIRITDTFGKTINIIDSSGHASSTLGLTQGNHFGTGPKYIVSTHAEMNNLSGLVQGDKVYVEKDENLYNYWTLWQYVSPKNFTLLNIQSYDTNNYWNYTDWYAEGYDESVFIDVAFPTINAMYNSTEDTGTIAKVLNSGAGKWAIYEKQEDWVTIAKESSTIEFSDKLYNESRDLFGFSSDLFDTKPFDNIPSQEFRNVMDAIRKSIFVTPFLQHQNILFFKMVRYAHTEHEIIDWCFKTSYIYLVGFSETLEQRPLYTYDGFESLVDYVNEVKPYHAKIKDVIRTFATVIDDFNLTVSDFDKPPYFDGTDTKILDPEVSADMYILSNEKPWQDWWKEHTLDNRPAMARSNNVRKIKTSMIFDRTSAVRKDYLPSLKFSAYPDFYGNSPFFESEIGLNNVVTRDNPTWYILYNYTGGIAKEVVAKIRPTPVDNIVNIVSTGIWNNGSSIKIRGYKKSDLTGDFEVLLNVTSSGLYRLSYSELKDFPYIVADYTDYEAGDSITVRVDVEYQSATSRALAFYKPSTGMANLRETVISEYKGVTIDGSSGGGSGGGWDTYGWDTQGWDTTSSSSSTVGSVISGGAWFSYLGDDSTDTYDLPTENVGVGPWKLFISNVAIYPTVPVLMVEGINFTVNETAGTFTVLDTGDVWNSGSGNLNSNYLASIFDSTYDSAESHQIIIDGGRFIQPHIQGWPEELTPLIVQDSLIITVETSGNFTVNLIEDVDIVYDGLPKTFAGVSPLIMTVSGISGDTVVIEGSNTGAFTGEESTIETITTDSYITVPDVTNGYTEFVYYRARVTNYSAGNITVNVQMQISPQSKRVKYIGDGVADTFDLGINVNDTDDVMITVNGTMTLAYTVNPSDNTVTFNTAPANLSEIQITSWNTTGVLDTNPIWASDTYASAAIALNNFGGTDIDTTPNEPVEGNLLVFAENIRQTPPEILYFTGNGEQEDYPVSMNQLVVSSGDVEVYLNNTLQTISTDYTFTQGGYTNPQITISAGGTGYSIDDLLTITGGTGTSTTFKVAEVNFINGQTQANFNGVGSNGSFNGGSGYVNGELIYLTNDAVITVGAVSGGVVTAFTVSTSVSSGFTTNGNTVSQFGSSGTGTGFEITLAPANERVFYITVVNAGKYSVKPSTPNSATGGTGTGFSATLSNYSEIKDMISFNNAPVINSKIAIKTSGNENYFVSSGDIDFIGVTPTDTLDILTFMDDNSAVSMQTVFYKGNTNETHTSSGVYSYPIYSKPVGPDYVLVFVDGLEVSQDDYTIQYGTGWDMAGWDTEPFDAGSGGNVLLNMSVSDTTDVVITTFSGSPTFSPITYREFRGWDINPNDFVEFIRISNINKTTLANDLQPKHNSISVTDASLFPLFKGVVWINGERIEYASRDGGLTPGATGTLNGLTRGSKGTRKNKVHPAGTTIIPGDESHLIVNMDNKILNDFGTRLQASKNTRALFVNENEGTLV